MNEEAHFADAPTFHMALSTGVIESPYPAWTAQRRAWEIRAESQQGGQPWILASGQRVVGFADRMEAWKEVRRLQEDALPYTVGLR